MSTLAQRRTDLCTCGRERTHAVHGEQRLGGGAGLTHAFVPHPQPPALPPAPPQFHRIHAARINHVWVVDVYGSGKMGHGQAPDWLTATNAAIEDLQEKKS